MADAIDSSKKWQWVVVILTVVSIILAVDNVFMLRLFGRVIIENSYLYALIGLFLSSFFIIYPTRKGATKPAWYDIALFVIALVVPLAFAFNGMEMIVKAWGFGTAPLWVTVASAALWALAIEAARRVAGNFFMAFCLIISIYPMFAGHLPGILQGRSFPPFMLITYHAVGNDSMVGLIMRVYGHILLGFMLFAVVLQQTGGGSFFLKLSIALLGRARGGPAKVAVVASSLFGSISGSIIANVLTTGSFTIPAMKKMGYRPEYAGAVEACASTGGALMPPVMGAVAFIMASFLNVSYATVVVAAVIPSLLYYLGLLVQVDAEAVRSGIKGLPREQCPSVRQTLKEGWFYVFAFLLLVYLLFYLQREAQAPFYATIALLILTMFRKDTRLNLKKLFDLIVGVGKVLAQLMGMLLAIGLVVGSLSVTGTAQAFSGEVVRVAGGNIYLMLIMGFIASFILGMGLTSIACYVFLVVVLAPALQQTGLYLIGIHLFLLYTGILSNITPPVAVAAFAAAGLAQTSPMKIGLTAMRLGMVLYIIPFYFVLNPALIFHGAPLQVAEAIFTAVVGVTIFAGGLGGYLFLMGNIIWPARVMLILAGLLLVAPGWQMEIWGVGVAVAAYILNRLVRMRAAPQVQRTATR